MSTLAFDHVVIFVPDLKEATSQFNNLGFTVTPGGEHSHTHNALIIFGDQTYLELLALKPGLKSRLLRLAARAGLIDLIANSKRDMAWRLLPWITQPYGIVDWCLRSDSIQPVLARVSASGLPVIDGEAFQRSGPNGVTVRWRLGCVQNPDLPFLLEDDTDIALRVPLGEHTQHANGALSIRKLTIAVSEPAQTAANFGRMLASSTDSQAANSTAVTLGCTEIVFQPLDATSARFNLQIQCEGGSLLIEGLDRIRQIPDSQNPGH